MSRHPTPAERDERIVLPLDPEEALRGLLAVKPDEEDELGTDPSSRRRSVDEKKTPAE